ncbi:hypothetical protein BCT96_013160 [Vibrio splendidus]|nr:hypothetical protein VCRA2127O15_90102 [Vibrio crassostreae]
MKEFEERPKPISKSEELTADADKLKRQLIEWAEELETGQRTTTILEKL